MKREEIVRQIKFVFTTKNIPKPDSTINSNSGEAISIKRIFTNKEWIEVNQEDIIYHNSALGFLTHTAFQYYLPAYMMMMLNDIYKADIVASKVVNQLTLPLEVDNLRLMNFLARIQNENKGLENFLLDEIKHSTDNVAYFIERMNGFTFDQGLCINNFLNYLNNCHSDYFDEEEAAIASKRYWFKYTL